MKTKTIRQSVTIHAKAHDVFEALMDEKKHAKFTGGPAKISRRVGGKYTAYGDYMGGENLEIIPDKKIVQTWRSTDLPKDLTTKITFNFKEEKGKTKLAFTHSGVPEKQYEEFRKGWIDFYWNPLKAMLEKNSQ
ncbi:MAG: SRPBCC family protein [Bacteroidota bacterium]|nr:SRPBCC family protein [Bacteroidota bacterium]MDP4229947.1 SRPBCC family protein [Bacteroidota bacterium]MDP4235640.1 SRPBCC family protein [Bacteroidota bacterium]